MQQLSWKLKHMANKNNIYGLAPGKISDFRNSESIFLDTTEVATNSL